MEAWREDREGWCARIGDSLSSLDEDARALKRRTHTQQKVLDEVVTTQEDLAVSVKSSRNVGEVASASAMAPMRVRERGGGVYNSEHPNVVTLGTRRLDIVLLFFCNNPHVKNLDDK